MSKIKVGISIGDLNGIGLEIIIKTFKDARMMEFCTPIVYGSSKVASINKKHLEMLDFNFNIIEKFENLKHNKVNLLNIWSDDIDIHFGKSTINSGEKAFESLKKATEALKNKQIDVLVTAPINKASIKEKVSGFIGHTEFLEGNFDGESLMIMSSEKMKIAFLTGHIALENVKKFVTIDNLVAKTKKLNSSLIKDFGIRSPKIAVLGLNPHAGENGMLGIEDSTLIEPAIKKLNKEFLLDILGPFPADSFFTKDNLDKYDGILAMYHDQGLIPFKTLSFSKGVNFTGGLNIIRTSPVHGVAYDIAKENTANEESFKQAVITSYKIMQSRFGIKKLSSIEN